MSSSIDIERSVVLLKSKKNSLVTKKILIQEKLGNLRDERICMRNKKRLEQIFIDRKVLKNDLHNLEIEIKDINNSIKQKNILKKEFDSYDNEEIKPHAIISELKNLRKEYRDFSKDLTRVSSMRLMATNFEQKLESIINKQW